MRHLIIASPNIVGLSGVEARTQGRGNLPRGPKLKGAPHASELPVSSSHTLDGCATAHFRQALPHN